MTRCSGPCLSHCFCPSAVRALARLSVGYLVACVAYLLLTRRMGTPFADTLTPEQLKIKKDSSRARADVFAKSCVVGALVVYVLRRHI